MRVFTVAAGNAENLGGVLHRLLVIVDEVDDLAVIGRQLRHGLTQKLVTAVLLQAVSGSSALSATVVSMVSSSSASVRRRRAESALKRAIESNQVVTAERPSKRPACCHTSKNTSLSRSSARGSLPQPRAYRARRRDRGADREGVPRAGGGETRFDYSRPWAPRHPRTRTVADDPSTNRKRANCGAVQPGGRGRQGAGARSGCGRLYHKAVRHRGASRAHARSPASQLQVHGERPIFHAGDLSVDLVRRIVKVAGARNDTSMAQFRKRRPNHISEMPLERPSYVTRWRRTGWLGRPDSNLRISESEFVKSFEMAARLHTRLEGSYQARRWRRFVSASLARFACDDLYGAGGRGPAVVCEGSHGVTGSDSSYKE